MYIYISNCSFYCMCLRVITHNDRCCRDILSIQCDKWLMLVL